MDTSTSPIGDKARKKVLAYRNATMAFARVMREEWVRTPPEAMRFYRNLDAALRNVVVVIEEGVACKTPWDGN